MSVRYEVLPGGVAVLTLDNPPMNALGYETRRDLVAHVDRAQQDPGVLAVILRGSGRAFSVGADVREFNTSKVLQPPTLIDVVEAVECSPKPVIAALHSLALGGGLELALAAHYRVASSDTQVGLPEVKLGVLPGAGGTQRLPRAAGLEPALNMIVSGNPMRARELAQTRLFDRIVEGDPLEGALALAREVGARSGPHPRVRDLAVEHPNPDGFLEFARAAVAIAAKNLPAPLKCLDAIAAAVSKPFDEGLREERAGFLALVETPESKSLRHAFFAERAAAKIPDVGADVKPRTVQRVAIIGAGTMGGGIAMSFLNSGFPVTLIETNAAALERGIANILKNFTSSAKKGKLTAEEVTERMGRLQPTLKFEDVSAADLVIEAVFEDYAAKEAVFRQIDTLARPEAILATNTSTLDIDRIARFTSRPSSVVGMHFFSPANIMKLLEVVRGAKTASDVLATVMEVSARIGKTPVVARVCDGFIGNRMIEKYFLQAEFLLDEGALPQQVDQALESFGFAMGPFRMSDLAGNDIAWAIRKRRAAEGHNLPYSKTADLICEQGRFGQKTGAGWYDYKPGDRKAYPSRLVEGLIVDNSRGLQLARRRIADEEIVRRCVYALINEGAKILEEGVAARASDIDVVYLYGYGFPPWRGGPMFYADTVGLPNVLRAIRHYSNGYQAQTWTPAPLLVQRAESAGNFNLTGRSS